MCFVLQATMKYALLVLVVLFNSGFLIVSEVITSRYPGFILQCRDQDADKEYRCILSKFDNPDWIPDTGHDMQLRLRQDFFWHPTKRIRRECRQLTREEFQEMVDAINALKNDKVGNVEVMKQINY